MQKEMKDQPTQTCINGPLEAEKPPIQKSISFEISTQSPCDTRQPQKACSFLSHAHPPGTSSHLHLGLMCGVQHPLPIHLLGGFIASIIDRFRLAQIEDGKLLQPVWLQKEVHLFALLRKLAIEH